MDRAIKHKVYLGIDPGASGGLAYMVEGRGGAGATTMPRTERDVWDWLKAYDVEGIQTFAIIEQVGGYVGGPGNTGSSMFKFGMSYGGLRMALIAAGIQFEQVMPHIWQRAMGVPPRGKQENKGQFKNRLKAMAQQLFPNHEVTLATADALLLAEFCRRKCNGLLQQAQQPPKTSAKTRQKVQNGAKPSLWD